MGLILDTSAVIGWIELRSERLMRYLERAAGDEVPVVHAVTLGELERGVCQAGDAAVRRTRVATLEFARRELDVVGLDASGEQPALFGRLASSLNRKVSHNDCWITATAIQLNGTLVTQDDQLAKQLAAVRRRAGSPLVTWLADRAPGFDVTHVRRG